MISPCLWFDDEAQAAAELYVSTIPSSREVVRSHYPADSENPSGKPPGSVMTVEVELAGRRFTLLNGGPMFVKNPSVSFFLELPEVADVERVAGVLLEGGAALMELGEYPWSARYAWIADRFGVSWQIMHVAADAPTVVPCLMFTDAVHGRAEEALRHYAEILDGEVVSVEHYAPDAGPEGTLVHGRAAIGDGQLVAMDSSSSHDMPFNEGVSLQVTAKDQAEVDRLWDALTDGGQPGVCGWLTDRYGLSWQVVPESLGDWLNTPDPDAQARAFQAMMAMTKPDIAALQAALAGGPALG